MKTLKNHPGLLVECLECGHVEVYRYGLQCGECSSAWFDAQYDLDSRGKKNPWFVKSDTYNMWRYSGLLPIRSDNNIVSFEEGWTPVFRLKSFEMQLGIAELHVKDERRNPSGSFKDRQASLAISTLQEFKVNEIVVCSTGNVGVSYAAYCAKAGIKLSVFLPHDVSESKVKGISFYGANVIQVSGNYDESKRTAEAYAREKGIAYDYGCSELYNRESKKTIAYEIAEQTNWMVPGWYVQAVSGGSGPLGVWKGFKELHTMGLINKIPRIACIQLAGSSPMADSFKENLETVRPVKPITEIPSMGTGDPGFAYTLLRARLLDTGGAIIKVDYADAENVRKLLAEKEGLLVSPETSVAFAGLKQLVHDGIIEKNSKVLVNCSGR